MTQSDLSLKRISPAAVFRKENPVKEYLPRGFEKHKAQQGDEVQGKLQLSRPLRHQ